MYAIAFIIAMFAVPPLTVGGWAYLVERVPLTERGLNVSFFALVGVLLGFAVLLGVILPTPMPGV